MGRRLILRLAALGLAVIGVLVYPHLEAAWHSLRSPCAKAWTAKDLTALAGGSWERGALYHCDYFCNESFGESGSTKYTAFFDVNRDLGSSEAESWTKDLREDHPLPDGSIQGIDEYHHRVIVIRRPKGAVRLQFDESRFTDEQARRATELITPRLPLIDRYLANE